MSVPCLSHWGGKEVLYPTLWELSSEYPYLPVLLDPASCAFTKHFPGGNPSLLHFTWALVGIAEHTPTHCLQKETQGTINSGCLLGGEREG